MKRWFCRGGKGCDAFLSRGLSVKRSRAVGPPLSRLRKVARTEKTFMNHGIREIREKFDRKIRDRKINVWQHCNSHVWLSRIQCALRLQLQSARVPASAGSRSESSASGTGLATIRKPPDMYRTIIARPHAPMCRAEAATQTAA